MSYQEVFWVNFWANLTATLIGVIVGIPIAFWIDSKRISISKKEEELKDLELKKVRANTVLTALENEITHNLTVLQHLESLKNNEVALYTLRISAWDIITSNDIEAINNFTLIEKIHRLYHDYNLINQKINSTFQIAFSVARALDIYSNMLHQINSIIKTNSAKLIILSNDVLKEIQEKRINLKN